MSIERKAGIHIYEDNLRKLLMQFYYYEDNIEDMVDEMVLYLMQEGKKLSLEKRTLNITNQTLAKKALNKATNDKTDISQLAKIILLVRKQLKHKGIKAIDNLSPDWVALKKLTPIVNQFCQDFELDKKEGYTDYVKLGLSRITSFRGYINKLYDMSEAISNLYEAEIIIKEDPNRELTENIHNYYMQLVITRTGIHESYRDKPYKYVNFIRVSETVIKHKVDYKIFIDAQFDGLEWTGNYPQPEQLISEKSSERLSKFVYSSKGKELLNINSKKVDKGLTNILRKIKDGKNNN